MPRRASATAEAEPPAAPASEPERPSARVLLARLGKKDPRAALFCLLLLADPDLNQTEAYAQAYPSAKRDSANTLAPRLMKRPEVAEVVEALKAERVERVRPELELSADNVVRGLLRIAGADLRDVASWDKDGVTLKASAEISDDAAFALKSVEHADTEHGTRVKVVHHDKIAALRALGDHLPGFWAKQQVEHSGTVTLAELLAAPPAGATPSHADAPT